MPKFEPVGEIEGADALLLLIQFLADPHAYAARLAALQTLREQINGGLERTGQAENIPALYEVAKKERQEVAEKLRQAREDAATTVKAAYASRDVAFQEADEIKRLSAEARSAMEADRRAWETERADRQAAVAGLEAEAREALDRARKDREDAAALKSEWNEKVGRLKAAGVA